MKEPGYKKVVDEFFADPLPQEVYLCPDLNGWLKECNCRDLGKCINSHDKKLFREVIE